MVLATTTENNNNRKQLHYYLKKKKKKKKKKKSNIYTLNIKNQSKNFRVCLIINLVKNTYI